MLSYIDVMPVVYELSKTLYIVDKLNCAIGFIHIKYIDILVMGYRDVIRINKLSIVISQLVFFLLI